MRYILRKLNFSPGAIVMLKLLLNVKLQTKVCDSFSLSIYFLCFWNEFSSRLLVRLSCFEFLKT